MASWEEAVAAIQSAKDKISEDQDHLNSAIERTEHTRVDCEVAANSAEEVANANLAMTQIQDAHIATSAKEKIQESRDQISLATDKAAEALSMLSAANDLLDTASTELQSLEG